MVERTRIAECMCKKSLGAAMRKDGISQGRLARSNTSLYRAKAELQMTLFGIEEEMKRMHLPD